MDLPTLSLREWYEQYFVVLFHADAAPRTVNEYRGTFRCWEKFTENRLIYAITSIELARFLARLREHVSPATVNKHRRQLNHLFTKLGAPGPHNRDALGALDVAPCCKQLRESRRRPKAATFAAIDRVYRAAAAEHDPDYWRAFPVAAYNLGSRRGALFALRESDVDWRIKLYVSRQTATSLRTISGDWLRSTSSPSQF